MASEIVGSFSKKPAVVADYLVDWSDKLDAGDTISNSSFAVLPATSPPLDIDSDVFADTSATVWLSGGAVGTAYLVENTVTTANGRTFVSSIQVRVTYLELGVTSFVTLAEADEYFGLVENATWLALAAGAREALLLRATRLLDRQRWRGDRAADDQALAWPRSGIVLDGVAVADDSYPQRLRDATCEIALAITGGSDVEDVANQSQKVQSIRAGSVALTYFRGAEGAPARFPQIVHELLRDMLVSGQLSVAGKVTGVSGESATGADFGMTEGI